MEKLSMKGMTPFYTYRRASTLSYRVILGQCPSYLGILCVETTHREKGMNPFWITQGGKNGK